MTLGSTRLGLGACGLGLVVAGCTGPEAIGSALAAVAAGFLLDRWSKAGTFGPSKAPKQRPSSTVTSLAAEATSISQWQRELPDHRDKVTEVLRHQDPSFDAAALCKKISDTFVQTQRLYSDENLAAGRRALSDGVFRGLSAQSLVVQLDGLRELVTDVEVKEVRLTSVDVSGEAHVVEAAIFGRARSYTVPRHAAPGAPGAAPAADFVEMWAFTRSAAAKSKAGPASRCGNCGAEVTGDALECEFCHAYFNSGHHDWVASLITLPRAGHRARRDVQALKSRDAGFSAHLVEDRAALVFWKLVEARSRSETAPIRRFCAPELFATLGADLDQLRADGLRTALSELALRDVELVGLATEGTRVDRALVRVAWSARLSKVPLGEAIRGTGEPVERESVIVLERRYGRTTPLRRGLASERCANCGAVVTDGDTTACDSCGTELTGSEAADWLLTSVGSAKAWKIA